MINDLGLFKELFKKARKEVLEIYNKDFSVEYKEDKSPLTEADTKMNELITNFLKENYEFPILSEEGKKIPFEERCLWNFYWLVDPIDGTKSFIKKTDDFTLNICLMQGNYPVFGFIYIPVFDELYFGGSNFGSFKISDLSDEKKEYLSPLPYKKTEKTTFVASKDHLDEETKSYIDSFEGEKDFVSIGSSIKFCYVAEGRADIYPRFGPTMEWDIAAGQAISEGANKEVLDFETKKRFSYNKEDLKNGSFLVK